MNFLRRCARATTALPSSLASYNSRHCTCYLRPLDRSLPYSINCTGGPNSKAKPFSSSLSQEVNKQAKEHLADSPIREIPYQPKVANLVKLIGRVKMPVKFQSFPNGKHYAATLICENLRSDNGCWIPVLFEGDLAYLVSCHVKENDCVYVTGKLSVDPLPFALDQSQWAFHILSLDINFVKGFVDKTDEYSREKNLNLAASPDFDDGNIDSEKKSRVPDFTDDSSHEEIDVNVKHSWSKISVEDLEVGNFWTNLVKNPNQWLNYTEQKSKGLVSQKYPDFKNRETGTSLWLDRAPQWFLVRFKNLDFGTSVKKQVVGNDSKIDELWKSVVENPDQWWDNRFDKKSAKAPDFKHKKTGEGLWLNSSPEWFVSKDIGIDKDNKGIVKDKKEAWKSLVENPNQWWDNRLAKKNGNSPDFKHKDSDEGIWLNGLPDWVLSKLPPLKQNQNV